MDVMDEMDTVDQLTVSPGSRRQKPVTNLPPSPARLPSGLRKASKTRL